MVTRILVIVLCLGSSVFAQPAAPATPAGKVLQAWLTAFNSGEAAAIAAFDAAYRPDPPAVDQTLRFRSDTGGFTLLRIEKSSPTIAVALLEERDSRRLARLELEV